jgi:hypothetical protein
MLTQGIKKKCVTGWQKRKRGGSRRKEGRQEGRNEKKEKGWTKGRKTETE